ncbi:MAG TPA: hypothetical protein VLK25_02985, partial [Allosphingosinicella sp.]|nr:hypothetical protein [Allosphingosinicella sp.]
MNQVASANDAQHTTRRLTIIAQDPAFRKKSAGSGGIVTASAELPAEELLPGPTGYRVKVIDYDVSTDTLYAPAEVAPQVDAYELASDHLLLTDPRFHAQNVYAIVMRTLARFEKALGRRVDWGCDGHQLHVVPHAFAEPNAFYSRADRALFFGYFRGSDGDLIYTCLSHDVIAHEATHAILDGLRGRFFEPSSPDQAAFHEGFADIVSMLSIFSLPAIISAMLDDAIKLDRVGSRARARSEALTTLIDAKYLDAKWLKKSAIFGLAEEMGRDLSSVRGSALRRSVELDPKEVDGPEFLEEHRRGEILVAAMLNAFLDIWLNRISRVGVITDGKKDRSVVVEAGARVADHLLTMAIRAIDYCPPVDLSFSDYLSAMLTVDKEVVPDDDLYGYRAALLRQFGRYGIKPSFGAARDGTWRRCTANLTYSRTHFASLLSDKQEMFRFLWENREALEIERMGYIEIESVRPALRVAPDGFILRETVSEYVQMLTLSADELREMGIEVPDWI